MHRDRASHQVSARAFAGGFRICVASVGGGVLLSACSLLVSTDGFSIPISIDDGGVASDTANDGKDANDRGQDSAKLDSTSDGKTPLCSTPHTFCSDFETGMVADILDLFGSDGNVRIDSARSVSPTKALVIQCGVGSSCGAFKRLPTATAKGVRVDFEISGEDDSTRDSSLGSMDMLAIDFTGGTDTFTLTRGSQSFGAEICDATGCGYTSGTLGAISGSTFHHITVDLRWAGASTRAEVLIDHVSALVTPFPSQDVTALRVSLGCEFTSACPGSLGIRVDDLVIDTDP